MQAIENTEEERNAIQVEVDAIRRRIQQAVADRARLVESVKETGRQPVKARDESFDGQSVGIIRLRR